MSASVLLLLAMDCSTSRGGERHSLRPGFYRFLLTCKLFLITVAGMFTVKIKKPVVKSLDKMPVSIQEVFFDLVRDLESKGPVQPEWANYSKLGANEYHCHLSYKWIACWKYEKNTVIIEVYYAGSRENAPY